MNSETSTSGLSAGSSSALTAGSRATLPKRRKSNRAGEMLAAARKVFSEKGFEAASISEIAREADCVEGTIYTYFDNKRALLDAVLASYYDDLISDIGPRLAAISGTEDRLSFLIARHLRIPLEDPGISMLIRTQVHGAGEYFGSALHGLNKRYSRFITDTLEQGKARGEIRPDVDANLVRDLIYGGIEHWSWKQRSRRRQYDAAKVARQILATLYPGLRVDNKASRHEATAGAADAESLQQISARLARLETLVAAELK